MAKLKILMQITLLRTLPLCALLAFTLGAAHAAEDTRPNIILILADDLGYGDIGAYGSTLIATPHIDAMARRGSKLEGFYSSANVCTAARGGLISGRYPIRLDLVADVARPSNDIGIAEDEITLGEALQGQGYATALVGKWHLGEEIERNPTKHGFDYYYGLLHSNDMAPVELYRNTDMIEFPVDQTTLTRRYTEEAIQFIEQQQEQPFFLYFPHSFPHVPLFTNDTFAGQSNAGLYGDVVEEIDWSVGQIIATLERLGLAENTLVMFTSDNGPWFEGSAGNFRERKGTAWEGGLRVPFVAQWPAKIPAASVSAAPVMNIDVFPTVMQAVTGSTYRASETLGKPIDGKNILSVLQGNESSPHDALYLFDRNRIAGVRSGNWKLVAETKYQTSTTRFTHPSSYYGKGLLFDLEKDPAETYSFARENPQQLQRMLELLAIGEESLSSYVPNRMWSDPRALEN